VTVREAVKALAQAAMGASGAVKAGDVEYVLVPRDALQLLLVATMPSDVPPSERPAVAKRFLRRGKVPDMSDLHPEQR